jgi:hypothetical protein
MVGLTLGNGNRARDELRQSRVELIEHGQLGRRSAVVEVKTQAIELFFFGKNAVPFEQYGALNAAHIIPLVLHAKVTRC